MCVIVLCVLTKSISIQAFCVHVKYENDKQDWEFACYLSSAVSTGGELSGLSIPDAREGSRAETLPLAHEKNIEIIMLL